MLLATYRPGPVDKNKLPKNHGKVYKDGEKKEMLIDFMRGLSLAAMSEVYARTVPSLLGQLQEMTGRLRKSLLTYEWELHGNEKTFSEWEESSWEGWNLTPEGESVKQKLCGTPVEKVSLPSGIADSLLPYQQKFAKDLEDAKLSTVSAHCRQKELLGVRDEMAMPVEDLISLEKLVDKFVREFPTITPRSATFPDDTGRKRVTIRRLNAKEEFGSTLADAMITDDKIDQLTKEKEMALNNVQLKIEKQTLINGVNINEMSEDKLIEMLMKLEQRKTALANVETDSLLVKQKLEEVEGTIKELVEIMDSKVLVCSMTADGFLVDGLKAAEKKMAEDLSTKQGEVIQSVNRG